MAQKTPNDRERKKVLEILTGIGPDVFTSEFIGTYQHMILTLVRRFELEQKIGKNKELRAAANLPGLSLLVALLKMQPSFWDVERADEPPVPIKPIELAKRSESDLSDKLQANRTMRIIEDTLAIFEPGPTAAEIQKSLIADRTVRTPRETFKRAIMNAAQPLAQLGLIRIQESIRGKKQKVTSAISLTDRGAKFVLTLFRHAVSASADHHPAFIDPPTASLE